MIGATAAMSSGGAPIARAGAEGLESARSSHEPSSRRTMAPSRASSARASDTVGRRAPTSRPSAPWVTSMGTTTPVLAIRPHRSARCHMSARRRNSTRGSWEIARCSAAREACREARAMSRALSAGHACRAGSSRSSRIATVAPVPTCQLSPIERRLSVPCPSAMRSPGPSRSAVPVRARSSSRTTRPSQTMRAKAARDTGHSDSSCHGPRSSLTVGTPMRSRARTAMSPSASARSRSRSSKRSHRTTGPSPLTAVSSTAT